MGYFHPLMQRRKYSTISGTTAKTLYFTLRLNVHKKHLGIYTGPYLQDTEIQKLVLNKTVLAHLSGQVYSLSGAYLGLVIACFRVLFSHSCALTSSWTDTILDPEFNA